MFDHPLQSLVMTLVPNSGARVPMQSAVPMATGTTSSGSSQQGGNSTLLSASLVKSLWDMSLEKTTFYEIIKVIHLIATKCLT